MTADAACEVAALASEMRRAGANSSEGNLTGDLRSALIATGVLDYSLAPEAEEDEDHEDLLDESDMSNAAT